MKKRPRITIFLTDDEYELIKWAAMRKRRTIRNYAERVIIESSLPSPEADEDQDHE